MSKKSVHLAMAKTRDPNTSEAWQTSNPGMAMAPNDAHERERNAAKLHSCIVCEGWQPEDSQGTAGRTTHRKQMTLQAMAKE